MKNPQQKPLKEIPTVQPWFITLLYIVCAAVIGVSLSTIGRVRVKTEKRTITNTIKESTNGTLICEQDWDIKFARIGDDWLEVKGSGVPKDRRHFITRKGKFTPDGHDGEWDEKIPVTDYWALTASGNASVLTVFSRNWLTNDSVWIRSK